MASKGGLFHKGLSLAQRVGVNSIVSAENLVIRSEMRLFMWPKDQNEMALCLSRLLSEGDSLLG